MSITANQMSDAQRGWSLALTEANHTENEFYVLGGATFLTEQERQASIDALPAVDHDCQDPAVERCYLVDILAEDEFSIEDNIHITEAAAHTLLGVSDFEPLREGNRRLWAAAREVSGE